NWLWSGRNPEPESETRGKIVQMLGELGPDAGVAGPALETGLRDFSVFLKHRHGKGARQGHGCASADSALRASGPAGAPAPTSAAGSSAICSRFFEPHAPMTGDMTRLGELAARQLEEIGRGIK